MNKYSIANLINRMLTILILLSLILAVTPARGVRAASVIRYVKPGGMISGLCESWGTACDLQYALGLAMSGDDLWVVQGTYKPTSGIDRAANFHLKTGVGLYGGFDGTETNRNQRDWISHVTTLSGDIGEPSKINDNSYHVINGSGTDGSAVLDGFTVTGGYASTTPPNSDGGGMYNINGNPSLANIVFDGNFAHYRGGGIYNSYSSNPILTNVLFTGNSSGDFGGGMFNNASSPSLTGVTFTLNSAVFGGGLDNIYSSPSLTDVSFESNSASNIGGGMYNKDSSPSLTNVTFTGNSAVNQGGGMYNSKGNPSLTDVTFTDNSAGFGGGIYNTYSNPGLANVTFTGNSATNGGGMHNTNSSPSLKDVTFDVNSANYRAGGMYNSDNSNPILTDVTFTGNSTSDYGGGIYNSNSSNPILVNVNFTLNSAMYGGGIYNILSKPSLTGVTFKNNSANDMGGGLFIQDSNPNLTNVTFTGNSAVNQGGGMSNTNSTPSLVGVTFTDNSAVFGGGISNIYSSPSLANVTFTSNNATNGGGMSNTNSNPALKYVTFDFNSAINLGGGMYNSNNSNPSLANITFNGNTANNGGGMSNTTSSPTLVNIIFNSNSATDRGGGIYNASSNPNLVNVTLDDNSAANQGGGIYNSSSNPSVHNSILWDNSPNQVFNLVTSNPTITYSDLQDGCPAGSNCTNVINADPLFVNPVEGDLRLQGTSPAIDSGDNNRVPSDTLDLDNDGITAEPLPFDLTGNPRFIDIPEIPDNGNGVAPIVDVGAYERQLNFAPIAVDDSYSTLINTPLTVPIPGVLGNDSDSNDDPFTAVLNVSPAHGTLTLDANGSFVYTPALNYNGSDSFTYHASDGELNSNIAIVNINIKLTNYAPAAMADAYTTNEDELLLVSFPGVLGNDTDPDDDQLIAILDSGPTHGSLTLNANGSFIYNSLLNYNGSDNFTYHASDGELNSNVAMVSLTIIAVNDPPVANNDSYTMLEDIPLAVPAPGVLSNDTDVDVNILTAVLDIAPTHGMLTLNPNGSFNYSPNYNYHGTDSFTYHTSDGKLDSNIATVNITVEEVITIYLPLMIR